MTFQRAYSAFRTADPRIPYMADFFAWYDRNDLNSIRSFSNLMRVRSVDDLEAMPVGHRVVQLRWLLVNEAYVGSYGADPLPIFESGGQIPLTNAIRLLRPFCNELKRRNIIPDGVFIDTEAGFSPFDLSQQELSRIYASPIARSRMPPRVRDLNPATAFHWTTPDYRTNIINFSRWTALFVTRALRKMLVESGLMVFNTPQGRIVPPLVRYGGLAPTFRIHDPHDWPQDNRAIDGRTSNSFIYRTNGARYQLRVHDYRWNLLVDVVNWGRSCLRRPGSLFWPLLNHPGLFHNSHWYCEQIVAHLSRTGVNLSNNNRWIFWNEHDSIFPNEGRVLADMLDRHNQPWPALRNLPEVPLDTDRIETAGFVTTYEEFITRIAAADALRLQGRVAPP